MSNALFPILPGIAFSILRTPQWSSNVDAAKSGRQYSVSDRIYPTYKWKLPYEFLRAYGSYTEQQQLFGFINSLRGRGDSFLYRDPNDYVVAGQALGIGTGAGQTFGLVRAFGGFVEPIIADSATIYVAGTPTAYGTAANQWVADTASPNTANVIFTAGATAGAAITWSGTYLWRCRLLSDAIPFEQFMSGYWRADIEFESFRP